MLSGCLPAYKSGKRPLPLHFVGSSQANALCLQPQIKKIVHYPLSQSFNQLKLWYILESNN
jgi:hypothetical protein